MDGCACYGHLTLYGKQSKRSVNTYVTACVTRIIWEKTPLSSVDPNVDCYSSDCLRIRSYVKLITCNIYHNPNPYYLN
jgi:hypothetical protein